MRFIKVLSVMFVAVFLLCSCGNGEDVPSEAESSFEIITSINPTQGTFYYPDENFNNYLSEKIEFDGTAQDVIDKLTELGNYGDNTVTVKSWYIKGNTMYIDFDQGLAKATGSSAQEYFSIYGTAATLKSCFGVTYVRFTIDGEDFNTPHGEYDKPL